MWLVSCGYQTILSAIKISVWISRDLCFYPRKSLSLFTLKPLPLPHFIASFLLFVLPHFEWITTIPLSNERNSTKHEARSRKLVVIGTAPAFKATASKALKAELSVEAKSLKEWNLIVNPSVTSNSRFSYPVGRPRSGNHNSLLFGGKPPTISPFVKFLLQKLLGSVSQGNCFKNVYCSLNWI